MVKKSPPVVMTGGFCYATAQLTPRAVPTAANIAEARFHRNLISLDLFSLVIFFFLIRNCCANRMQPFLIL